MSQYTIIYLLKSCTHVSQLSRWHLCDSKNRFRSKMWLERLIFQYIYIYNNSNFENQIFGCSKSYFVFLFRICCYDSNSKKAQMHEYKYIDYCFVWFSFGTLLCGKCQLYLMPHIHCTRTVCIPKLFLQFSKLTSFV